MTTRDLERRVAALEVRINAIGEVIRQDMEHRVAKLEREIAMEEEEKDLIRLRFKRIDDTLIRIERLEERARGIFPEDDDAAH